MTDTEFYRNKMIDFIRENKLSTTEVADSIAKTGGIPSLSPVCVGDYMVGVARCMFTANGTNYYLHGQLDDIEQGEIPLIFSKYCEGRAIFGDIMAQYMIDRKKAQGIVLQGEIRDLDCIRRLGYNIWHNGTTPVGCINKPTTPFPAEEESALRYRYDNCILVCDGCGVVAIPEKYHNNNTLDRMKALQLQEKVWNYCIDELGWDTVDTICNKRYLKEVDVLPEEIIKHIDLLKIDFSIKPESNY